MTSQSISETQDGIELHVLRSQHSQINDRIDRLKAEIDALLRTQAPIEARIRELEDKFEARRRGRKRPKRGD